MALFISFDFSYWARRSLTIIVSLFDVSHFQRQVLLESVTYLHRITNLLLFITLCFIVIFCTIDRSKHKPCVFTESNI